MRLPLKDCKLWWPGFSQGVPFKSFGFGDHKTVKGIGYEFHIDPDMDSWLVDIAYGADEDDVQITLMPIASAVLEDCDDGPIKWTSFSIVGDGSVQVNYQPPGESGYHIDFYPIDALAFVGETYIDGE